MNVAIRGGSDFDTIGDSLRLGAQRFPARAAVRMLDGPVLSYAELDNNTDRLANAMTSRLIPGERVAIWMENCLEYLETYLACVKAGVVVVQVNIRHTAHEAQFQLEDAGAVALIFSDSVASRVESLPGIDALRLLVTTGRERVAGAHAFADFRAVGRATPSDAGPGANTLAVLAYTSGTTGFPKGAMLTHKSIRAIGQTNALANRYSIGSTQVFALSLSFAAGIPAHVLPHLAVGGTTILMPSFDTARLVDALDRHHANFTVLPSPPIVEFCAIASQGGHRLDSLVSLLHGAGKAPPEHLELLTDVIGSRLVEGWGMTENSGGLVAATTAQDYATRRPGIFSSTGRPVPDTVVKVVGTDGEQLPHDGTTVGQLVFRSNSLSDGYWNDSEATSTAFRDGWYQSGDVGTIDSEGYIEVLDRRVDLIVSGGANVYPSEVERVILQVPGIAECAVIGVPDPRWGQTPVAFLVRTNDAQRHYAVRPSLAEVKAHCRERLAGYKQPSAFEFIDALPRNAGGKVMRHLLRQRQS